MGRDVLDVEPERAAAGARVEAEPGVPEHDISVDDPRTVGPGIRRRDRGTVRRVSKYHQIERIEGRGRLRASTRVDESEPRVALQRPDVRARSNRVLGFEIGQVEVRGIQL